MLLPSIFNREMDLFDDWMDFPTEKELNKELFGKHNPLYGKKASHLMKTDVKESKDGYEVDVDLPGFKKEDIKISLENGYLTILAEKNMNKETKNDNDKFIRKERYTGSCSRSFYLGENYTPEDLKAKYESGILKLCLPKKECKQVQENNYISIE